jgi:hypothetical protein
MAFQQLEDSIRNILKRLGVLENTPPATVADASSTVRGIVELATSAEAIAGTDSTRAVTATALAASRLRPTQGVIPSSVAVGSGSATVNSDGLITFTGVSSVSLNNVFDGLGGDVYRMMIDITETSTALNPSARLRNAGADNSAGIYDSQLLFANGSSVSAAQYGSQTSHSVGSGNRDRNAGTLEIMSPALEKRTSIKSESWQSNSTNSFALYSLRGGFLRSTLAFDGVTLFTSTGTMTGTVKVEKIS